MGRMWERGVVGQLRWIDGKGGREGSIWRGSMWVDERMVRRGRVWQLWRGSIPRGGSGGIAGRGFAGEKWYRKGVEMFEEGDMERVKDASVGRIPKAVGFGVRRVTNENARGGSLEELGIVRGDKRVGAATNFAKM